MKAHTIRILGIILLFITQTACNSDRPTATGPTTEQNKDKIVGVWKLQSRLVDGAETPATERRLKLKFEPNGTFTAYFQGDESQPWIKAGQGAFTFMGPSLNLYWESGNRVVLLAKQSEPTRLYVHHGGNMAPLVNQEPDEIFVRES